MHGRKPRGTGGTPPPSLRWGDGPCIRLPNILRSSVCRMTKKNCYYQNGKKGVFLARKGLCTISNKGKIRKIRKKRGKIRKTWSMAKKKSKFFAAKMGIFQKRVGIFPKKVILVREEFFRPPKLDDRFPPLPACKNGGKIY